jgi:hypothetical protein
VKMPGWPSPVNSLTSREAGAPLLRPESGRPQPACS